MSQSKNLKLASSACFGCLFVVLFLANVGCKKVKKPKEDSTPPKLVWNVYNYGTNAQADHPGSPTINAKRGAKFRVTLKANDPEGANWIKINPSLGSGEMKWTCKAPPGGENLGQAHTADLAPMTRTVSPDANGNVLTSIFLLYDLDFKMECQSGWSFTSGSATLTGQASNYFGGVTTETLTFQISP